MNPIPSIEKQITEKLIDIIEANFTNEQFSVIDLANEMGMSRSTLHRKIKAYSGKTVSKFINEVRLKAAKQLLNDKSGTVAEVAYLVGFRSSTYFNKCFNDYFGYPPGKLLNGNHKTSEISVSNENNTKKKYPLYIKAAGVLLLLALLFVVVNKSYINGAPPKSKSDTKILSSNQAALNLYQQGLRLMDVYKGSIEEEHFLEAKMKYEEAIQLDSTFGDAYSHLANIYLSLIPFSYKTNKGFNYADSGRIYLDKAEKFGVCDSEFLLRINSHYYQREGDYSKALEIFEQLWENKDKDYNYYSERGNHGFHARNYSEGIGNLLKYLELKPDSILSADDRLLKLTLLFSRTGFSDEAQEFAYRQFERNVDTLKYWNRYPLIAFEGGNFEEAIRTYKTAYGYNNVNATVYNKLLEIYLFTGEHEKALKLLPEVVSYYNTKYKKAIPNYLLAYYHWRNNEIELAEWHFKEEIKRWERYCSKSSMQQSKQNYITIAACYSMLGDKKGTIESLEKLKQKTSIPYLVVLKLQQSPLFNNFRDDHDFLEIRNDIEKKFYEEQKKIHKILAQHTITLTYNLDGNIVATPL